MTFDPSQFRLAPTGHVYVAPTGTAQPTDVSTAWAAGWTELGYLDENGVKVTPALNTTEINSWQSATPTKIIITGTKFSLDVNLQQSNLFNLQFYFWNSTWATSGGINTQTILSAPTTDERMLGVEWTDVSASITNRLVIPRGMATSRQAITIDRKSSQVFGLTFEALDSSGVLAYLLSNDANE